MKTCSLMTETVSLISIQDRHNIFTSGCFIWMKVKKMCYCCVPVDMLGISLSLNFCEGSHMQFLAVKFLLCV